MIPRPKPERFRLRRTMMFMNAQKPGLIKDAYIYGADTIMLDLEDAVAENQKDAARFSLYHALTTIDYGNTEVLVRINGLDTPHWEEDIRVAVAGGADGIRISKCESAADVKAVEEHILAAEREFGVEEGRTLIMAALESAKGVVNAYEICCASDRMFGIALAGGDFRKDMHVKVTDTGIDIMVARGMILLAARAAGVQCFDTNFADFKNMEGFEREVHQNRQMGFDGKSIINPRQIRLVNELFSPSDEDIAYAERLIRSYAEQYARGVGVYTVDGKMVDIAFIKEARNTLKYAKECGKYSGDLDQVGGEF
jgi:citrate lyase subunit beta/citryl-CoA lyase